MLRQIYSRISSAIVTRRFLATQSLETTKRESLLLTPAQVKDLKPSTTRILDVTWFMPNSPRNARDEFNQLRVAGAKYMDLDEVATEHPLGLKHMMPSPQQFKDACGEYLVLLRSLLGLIYIFSHLWVICTSDYLGNAPANCFIR